MRPSIFTLVSLVFVGFFARMVPHPMNFTPIVAMALLAGVYAKPRWLALAIPFAAMFVSDLVLNNTLYAAYFEGFSFFGIWGVYAALAAVALLPLILKATKGSSLLKLTGVGVGGATIFFLVSNLADWATYGMYPMNPAGLLACYVAGLPFFLNTLLSTLLFGSIGVAVMRAVELKFGKLQAVRA
ncbi:MAG: DUF6580 family putative transport protein [Saprospiraceae bacterium]